MAPAAQQFTTPADEPVNQAVIDNRAPSVAHLFRSRVEASEHEVAYQFVRDGMWGSLTWGQVREQAYRLGSRAHRPGRRSPRTASRSPPPPATSGSWPTWPSCAPAPPRPPSTRRRSPRTSPTSCPTPAARSSSPRTTSQVDKLREAPGRRSPACCRVVTFDGVPDGDWVDHACDELEQLGVRAA